MERRDPHGQRDEGAGQRHVSAFHPPFVAVALHAAVRPRQRRAGLEPQSRGTNRNWREKPKSRAGAAVDAVGADHAYAVSLQRHAGPYAAGEFHGHSAAGKNFAPIAALAANSNVAAITGSTEASVFPGHAVIGDAAQGGLAAISRQCPLSGPDYGERVMTNIYDRGDVVRLDGGVQRCIE